MCVRTHFLVVFVPIFRMPTMCIPTFTALPLCISCTYLFILSALTKVSPDVDIYCFFCYFLPSFLLVRSVPFRPAHFLDWTIAFVDGLAFVQCSVNSMMVKITVKSYLNGSLIWIYRSNEIAHRLRIEAVEHITSKATHVSQNCAPNTQ